MSASIVDSEILIDILNGMPDALTWLETMPAMAITPINWFEVMAGARRYDESRRRQTTRFLAAFEMLYVTEADQSWAMDAFRRYNPEFGVKWTDILIASVCVRLGTTLYARDNHFSIIPELTVRSPYHTGE